MAAPKVRIRAYQVDFGDCFLVSVPDGSVTRQLLVDFGNVVGKGGKNAPFKAIAEDIRQETNGHLDVAVMTHEHIDHMEGFYHQRKIFDDFEVDRVWMSYPSMPGYYTKYRKAEPHKKLRAFADRFAGEVRRRGIALAPSFDALLRNNLSNKDRIEYLRRLPGSKKRVHYLARGHTLRNKPFRNASGVVLAPEKDMSVYYGSAANHLAMRRLANALSGSAGGGQWSFPNVPTERDPEALWGSTWRRLRDNVQGGVVEAVRAIDKAANNTSLVFLLEVKGKRLLFPGDAELESWAILATKNKRHIKPVDFLKVSHHGSHNGTPLYLLDKLLPKSRKARAQILVSTKSKVYGTKNPVPDEALLKSLKARCRKLFNTDGHSDPWIDVFV